MMNVDEKIARFLRKAREKMASAKRLYEDGFLEDAISRAYYALFHAVVALLEDADVDLSVHKHAYILSQFKTRFVEAKIFPNDFFVKIMNVKAMREQADYSISIALESTEVKEMLKHSTEILDEIEKHLQNKRKPS